MTHFVVALRAEARPLIDRYRMKPVDGPFPAFHGDGGRRLVVSGVGKVAAAAAVAHLHDNPLGVWLNVGIAGHRDRTRGELVRAHTVTDHATGDRYFPTLVGLHHLRSAGVTTVDVPETTFHSDDVFDMEASGFCGTALRFSTAELVQCVKVVSDNLASGTDRLTGSAITELVESHVDTIDELVHHLEELAAELEPLRKTPELEPFLVRWRFTTSEKRRLHRLVVRHLAFAGPPRAEELSDRESASDVLKALEQRVRALSLEQQTF